MNIFPDVQFSLNTNKDTVCPGEPVLITGIINDGMPPYTITDEDGAIISLSNIEYPNQETTYIYTVSDACGSKDKDSVKIEVYDVPTLDIQTDILQGCQPLDVNFLVSNAQEDCIYYWSFYNENDNDIASGSYFSHTFEQSGIYDVSVTLITKEDCKNTLTKDSMIEVYKKPEAHFQSNPQIVSILNPQIEFKNYSLWADTYIWDFGDADSSSLENPIHKYLAVDDYIVSLVAISSQGCKDTAMQTIYVKEIPTLYVPTAFSPDGDDINDLFEVKANGIDFNHYNIKIYDRWGEIVFKSNDFYEPWDGTIKGLSMGTNDVYVWLITYREINGIEHQKSGTVKLIR